MYKQLKSLVYIGAVLLAFVVTLGVIEMSLMKLLHARAKKEVKGKLPGNFPVVVKTGERAQIVWAENLHAFKDAHPDYSFLIPNERKDFFVQQIESNTRANRTPASFDWSSPLPWAATFTLESVTERLQKFTVDATFDDDRMNIGWYDATDKEIFPRYHTFYFGPAYALYSLPIAFLLTVSVWSSALLIARLIRRRKRRE